MKEHFALILVICFMVASLGTVALCESDGVTVRVGKIVYGNGVFLFYYAEDIPSGAMALGEEERKIVRIAAQQNLSSRSLNELVIPWRNDYEIETDGTQLHY